MQMTTDELIVKFNEKFDASGDLDRLMNALGFEQARINVNPLRMAYARIGSDNLHGGFVYRDTGHTVIRFFSTNAPVNKISTHAGDKNHYTPYTLLRETQYNDDTRQAMAYVSAYLGVDSQQVRPRSVVSQSGELKTRDFANVTARHIAFVADFISERYTFVFNTVKMRLQYSIVPNTLPSNIVDSELKYFDDRMLNTLWADINELEKVPKETIVNVMGSGIIPEYNPVKNYLKKLPEWDGVDYIQKVVDTMDIEQDFPQKWAYEYLKKFLLSWILQLRGEAINNSILILQGGQGIRKTTFLRELVPPELRNYYFEGRLNSQDKDSLLVLHQNILVNLDELESFSYKELQYHKSLITRADVDVRAPYNKYFEKNPKLCSFVGSTNDAEMLSDTTGNRRFNIIPVENVDEDFRKSLNHAQMWAQAVALIQAGERTYFTTEEARDITMLNRRFEKTSSVEEMLLDKFQPATENDIGVRLLTATEIAEIIVGETSLKTNPVQLGKLLRKHGFKRKSEKGKYVWYVKPTIAEVGF